MSIPLPPIPESLADLITIENPHSELKKQIINKMKVDYQKIDKMTSDYHEKSTNKNSIKQYLENSDKETNESNNNEILPPHLKYIRKKLINEIDKHQKEVISIDSAIFKLLNQLKLFYQKAIEMEVPVVLDIKRLEPEIIISRYKSNHNYQYYGKRIYRMQNCLKLKSCCSIPEISLESLQDTFDIVRRSCNVKIGYASYSEFDVALDIYFSNTMKEELFQLTTSLSSLYQDLYTKETSAQKRFYKNRRHISFSLVKSAQDNPDLIDINCFHNSFQDLAVLFNADERYKIVVLKCAFVRILFDRIFLVDPFINRSNDYMLFPLKVLQNLTLRELEIPKGFYPEELFDYTLENVFKQKVVNIDQIMRIVDKIKLLPFINNPLDITYVLHLIIIGIEEIRNDNSVNFEKRMCFDDFFVIFASLISAFPPPNSEGIYLLLKRYNKIGYSSVLANSGTYFIAWVDFVKGFINCYYSSEVQAKIDHMMSL